MGCDAIKWSTDFSIITDDSPNSAAPSENVYINGRLRSTDSQKSIATPIPKRSTHPVKMAVTIAKYTKTLFNFLRTILTFYGFWIPFEKSRCVRVMHKIYGGFLYLFIAVFTFFLMASVFINTANERLTKRLFMSATKFAMLAKMLPLYFLNRQVQQIRHTVESFALKTPAEQHKVHAYVNTIAKVIYVYHMMPQICVTGWNLEALYSDERKLAYSGWYPFVDWQTNDHDYHYLLAYQFSVISVTGVINMAADSYFILAMLMISVEFELLGDRLSAMQSFGSARNVKQQLVEHMQTLKDIRRLADDVRDTLSWSYFVQVIMSGVIMGSTVQELAKVRASVLRYSLQLRSV